VSQSGCTINITSVVGGPTVLLTPTLCETIITVSGTVVSSLGSAPCPAVTVTVSCEDVATSTFPSYTATIDSNGVVTGQGASGFFVGQDWQLTLTTFCCCNTQVTVSAGCPSLNCSASEPVLLQCQPPCCPRIFTQVSYGACDGSGNALVTFTVSVYAATLNGCPETKVQMDFGDGSPLGAIHAFVAPGTFNEVHQYSSGPHTAFVNIISPTGCQQVEVPIDVPCPPSGCCPKITSKVSYECDPTGNSLVTFAVSVSPVTAVGCPETKVQMDFGDGSPPGAIHAFVAPGTFNEVHQYSSGPHTAFVNILSPTGCRQVQIPINVQCPPCCPDVTVTPCIPDCDSNANRTVTFQITVTKKPLPCPQTAVSFQMDFGDGSNGVPVTVPAGMPSYSYTETHTYTGSAALQANTASLQVSKPAQCAGTYSPHVIPACCKKARANWCTTLFWIMSFSLAFALLFAPFTIFPATFSCLTCLPFTTQPGYTPLYSFYLFAIIGVIALILYLLFCTKCRCDWFYFLLWRILFGAGLLYFVFANCSLGILSVLIALGLMLIGYLCLKKWERDCCVLPCDFLKEMASWLVLIMAIAVFLVGTSFFSLAGGCVYTLFTISIPVGFPPQVISFPITTMFVAVAVSTAFELYVYKKC
jgi:hypothetical protein